MTEFETLALEIGQLVTEKDAAYGCAVERVGKMLSIIYPNGIKSTQMDDALVITRCLDKMCRIATDNDPFGENPWGDINGYSLIRMVHQKRKTEEK